MTSSLVKTYEAIKGADTLLAANVVKQIFDMTLNGMGTEQIAGALTDKQILTPYFYWQSKGIRRPRKSPPNRGVQLNIS